MPARRGGAAHRGPRTARPRRRRASSRGSTTSPRGAPTARSAGVTRHLFDDLGFAGDTDDYGNPRQLAARRRARPASRHPDHAVRGADRGGPAARRRPGRRGHARALPRALGRRPRPVRRPVPPGGARPRGLREAVRDPARSQGAVRGSLPRPRRAPGGHRPHAHQPAAVLRRPAATGPAALWAQCLRVLVPGTTVQDRRQLAAMLAANGRFDAAAIELDAIAAEGGGDRDRVAARALRAKLN